MSTEINDGLTDEEREALAIVESDTGREPATEPKTEEASHVEPSAEKPQGEPAGTDPAADAAAAEPAASDAGAAAQPAAKQDEPAAAPAPAPAQSAPVLIAQGVEGAEAKLADIAAQKDALLQRFDDGDLTLREYQKQVDVLAKAERDIEFAQHEAQLAAKMEDQRLRNEWVAAANAFAASHGYTQGSRLYHLLDQEVRALAATEEGKRTPGMDLLKQAHENLAKDGLAPRPAASSAPPATPKPKVDKPDAPPSLHAVPAAEINDTGGRYADLDRLAGTDPDAYEAKLAAMSPAERDRYLRA